MKDKYRKALFFGILILMTICGIETSVRFLYPLNDIVKNWYDFYSMDKNSIDTLIVGSSHAYSSFDISQFEEKKGERAYILASNSQNAVQSYFYVKEALNYQLSVLHDFRN